MLLASELTVDHAPNEVIILYTYTAYYRKIYLLNNLQ